MRDFDRGTGVLVALHGHGDEPSSARVWGRRLAPPGWEVVAPGAPAGTDGVRSWFGTGPRGAVVEDLAAGLARLGHLLQGLGQGGRPVVVAGFSQGGAVALALAQSSEDRPVAVDAVVAVCPFLAEGEGIEVRGPGERTTPVLVLPAASDEAVPAFLGEDAAAVLAQAGHEVTTEVLPGGHEVSDLAVTRARAWLGEVLGGGPRFSVALPVDRVDTGAELVSGAAVSDLAVGFERLGFHAVYVTDHPAPDDRWLGGGGHHALEPTVALAVAGAATRNLLLHTNVYVLPYRNPFLAAKALASVDVLSGGRLVLGVAAGYLRPEFEALGVGFEDRTDRLEEALELLPRIWADANVAVEGAGFRSRGVTALPRPAHRPHPPIWVGGNSTAALRRAVRHAQGWSPFPTQAGLERAARTAAIDSLPELARRIEQATDMCAQAGRERLTICFAPFSGLAYQHDPAGLLSTLAEEVAELEELGVDWVTLAVPGVSRVEVLDRAAELADALGLSC